ncbi:hypothetical protein AV530_019922 [Patagioenas fasciata monilis]|uniref:Uncharacterized protein n=1 Tax=Patagioenas fasciata monilis TaxID=372326 RepID=A0A1V4JK41_PATFA|nr:hypothetical protein AV530_019922 [Patagioenas fasciata monilis]
MVGSFCEGDNNQVSQWQLQLLLFHPILKVQHTAQQRLLTLVRLIQAMKLQCIQLHRPITSSSSNRNRQRQQLLQLLQPLLGQGLPLLKRHHSKISNRNQSNLPNHPRSTTVMYVRSAVLDHRLIKNT